MPFDGASYDTQVTNPVTAYLESAWSLIDKPQKWCRGDYRSADGRRHCSLGALQATAANTANTGILDRAWATTLLYKAMEGSVIHFNDEHGHREVAAAWQRAIAMSRRLP